MKRIALICGLYLCAVSCFAQNGTAPLYQSTTSTANPGTIAPPFTSSSAVNSFGYDLTYNPIPFDAYTRLSDRSTFGGASVGNNSCGGGAFERMWSADNGMVAIAASGGFAYIFQLNLTGAIGQLANTGALPNTDRIICPVESSWVTAGIYYNVALNSSAPFTAINSNNFPGNNTHTSTLVVDLTNGTTCPGLPSGKPTHVGGFSVASGDGRFSVNMSFTGGQDTDQWGVVWDRVLGCQVVNSVTSSYWQFCLISCTPATAATGTLASATACTGASDCNCWGGFIHNSQMNGAGTVLSLSMFSPPWSAGVCSGFSNAAQRSDYLINTAITQWGHDSASPTKGAQYYDGHPFFGITHVAGGDNTVAAIHTLTNIEGFTQFQTVPTAAQESHIAWPNPLLDDSYPIVLATSDLPANGSGTNAAPFYLGNAIYSSQPNLTNDPYHAFGHTYSCNPNNVLWASCAGSHDFWFGCTDGIVTVSNDGNWAVIASGMLLGLGLDSSGDPACDAFLIHIGQGAITPAPAAPAPVMFVKNSPGR